MPAKYQSPDYYRLDDLLSDEQKMTRDTVRAWVDDRFLPVIARHYQAGTFPLDLVPQMAQLGLFGATLPETYGCAGMDNIAAGLVMQELERGDSGLRSFASVQSSLVMFPIFTYGSEEQRGRWLPRLARGEAIGCFGLTEPDAGSDPGSMKTRAVRKGENWILNGAKMWITNGTIADVAVVWAKTDEGIRGFLVDKGTPGFAVRDGYRNVSHRGYTNAVLDFDNCRIPQDQVLGEPHKGFEVANAWLGATRLQVAATCLGRAERALGHAMSYAAERRQFGQQIGKFQGVSFKLADMAMELKAAELLTREAAWKFDAGTVTEADMSMAKLKATEVLAFIADEAIQIHGGMGLMEDLPLERIWRDARVERIWEGTSEIQRHIISRELLRALGA